MRQGERNGFFWLVSTRHTLGDVVAACPELFVGRSVAVTSFDSGPLALTPEERDSGWQQRGDVAIAPRTLAPSNIPFDDSFDEWYVFDGQVPDFGSFELFVNLSGFSPEASSPQARFWDQLQRLQPSCYVAYGDLLTIVTKSEDERNRVWDALPAE